MSRARKPKHQPQGVRLPFILPGYRLHCDHCGFASTDPMDDFLGWRRDDNTIFRIADGRTAPSRPPDAPDDETYDACQATVDGRDLYVRHLVCRSCGTVHQAIEVCLDTSLFDSALEAPMRANVARAQQAYPPITVCSRCQSTALMTLADIAGHPLPCPHCGKRQAAYRWPQNHVIF